MATRIKVDEVCESDGSVKVTCCSELCILLKQIIEVLHICPMVLSVVEVEQVAAHEWFE